MPRLVDLENSLGNHRYILIEGAHVRLMMPVVSAGGYGIGLDNTCQSLRSLQTFLGKDHQSQVDKTHALHEVSSHIDALTHEIQIIYNALQSPYCEDMRAELTQIMTLKRFHCDQLKSFRTVLSAELPGTDYLMYGHARYPQVITDMMKEAPNIVAMQLNPQNIDLVTRFNDVAVCSFNRPDEFHDDQNPAFISNRLRAAFGSTAGVVDPKGIQDQLKDLVIAQFSQDEDENVDESKFEAIAEFLNTSPIVQSVFALDIDATYEYVKAILCLDDDDTLTLEECADTLINGLDTSSAVESPFVFSKIAVGDQADQASIRVQFFIGQINLYCHAQELSKANFGQVIELDSELKEALINAFSKGLTDGDLQEKLINFIQSHHANFGLTEPLTPENIADIVSRFNVNFNTVSGSQHFDEFVCLDTAPSVEGVASGYRYAGQMSLDFSAVAKRMTGAIPSNIDLPARTLTTLLEGRQDLTLEAAQEQSQPQQLRVKNTINSIEYPDEFLMNQLQMFKSRSDFQSCALLLIRKIEGADQYLFELPDYSDLTAEQVQGISSFIPAGLRSRFNAAARINSMCLNADQVRSLYNILMQENPTAKLDYRTTESVQNLLNKLGLDGLEVNVSPLGGFVVQIKGVEGVEGQAMIQTIQDKLSVPTNDHYLSPYMASQLYQAVADSEPDQYTNLMSRNNNGSPPDKINRALSLLGINGVRAHSNGYNGYVIRGINRAQINSIEQACQVRRLSTEAVAALYRAVKAQCDGTQVSKMNALSNAGRPEKLQNAMQLLGLNFQKIVPNMHADQKDGYWINCSFDTYEAIQRIGTEHPAPVEAVTMAQHPRGAAPAQTTRFRGRGRDGGDQVNDQVYALTGTEQPEPAPAPEPEIQAVAQQRDFQLEVVRSYALQASSTTRAPQSEYAAQLHGSTDILAAFQSMMQGSTLLGTTFRNPYLDIVETFPASAEDLTLRHLHLLARNESFNTTGVINEALYGGHLTHDQIARIRCLVKFTTGSAIVYRNAHGGYRSVRTEYGDEARPCIVVDQSGFQWQSDLKNTGALCIYLDRFLGAQDQPSRGLGSRLLTGITSMIGFEQAAQVPEGGVGVDLTDYTEFQQAMFRAIFSEDRPERPSDNRIKVRWNRHPAQLDLNLLSRGICLEMLQAIQAVSQTPSLSDVLEENQKVHFKFLKAGMGFFASGLGEGSITQALEKARLEGIASALESLVSGVGDPSILTHIGKISLPFSGVECRRNPEIQQRITSAMERLGIVYGGTPNEDALYQGDDDIDTTTQIQYLLATSNCGDPHALCGNEGFHQSVDASIGTNANLNTLNSGYNPVIQCRPYQASDLTPNLEGTLITQFNLIKDQFVPNECKEPIGSPLAALEPEPEPEDAQTVVQEGSQIKRGTWVRLHTDSHAILGSTLEVGCSRHSGRQAFSSDRYQIEIDGHALIILDKDADYSAVTNPEDKSKILNALSETMNMICAAHEQGPVSDASIAGGGAISADALSHQGVEVSGGVNLRSNRLPEDLEPSEERRPSSPCD